MKKLLIAMTAAAVGTCAWAEGEQTLLSESFTGWTLTGNTWWSYSAAAADGELTLTDGEDAKLSLNTGSKVLTGSFTSDDQPKAIGNGLYFNAKVTFKDPSDTLPTLGEADKFALVVLDNVESIDAEKATAPATNLMVIAKYGTAAQRAYELNVAVDSAWLAGEHEIVVKAYDNVMKSGSTACAGFLVMVDKTVCKVVNSYAIVDGVVDFGVFCAGNNFGDDGLGGSGNLGYLGYAKDAIAASMQLRYENAELLLSNVPGSDTLASVDFQGQGVIDDVSLATTGADFGADALVFTVEVSDGVTLTSDATVYYGAAGETKNITFTLAEGYVLKAPLAAVKGDNGVYTYAYTTVADNNQVVNIEAYKPAAYIGDTAYETFAEALAAGGTIELANNVSIENETAFQIESGVEVTIDLKGKTITASASVAAFENYGTLTITDSVGGGKVDGAIIGGEGAVYNLIGGSFKNVYPFVLGEGEDALTFDFPVATGFELINGYYVIKAGSSYTESEKLVEGDMTDDATAALDEIAEAIGGDAGDEEVAEYLENVGYNNSDNKVSATILAAAKADGTIAVSVNNNLPLVSKDAEFVAEPAVAEGEGNVAAFEFKLMDGETELTLTNQAKLEKIIKICTDLATKVWTAPKIGTDVDAEVTGGKIKVQLKSGKANFMKIQATAE